MKIGGLMKLTLLDFPDKVACTIFTAGCNFKCPFCHNAFLVNTNGDELEEEEILEFLRSRQKILDGVCITGGEPTIHPDLGDFIKKIKSETGLLVKLDTNGANPKALKALVNDGLVDYVAMDIKNSPDKYPETAGVGENVLEKVKESIDFLMENKVDFEFRTTVTNELHTDEDMRKIGEWIKGAPKYYIQPFKDSGDILESGNTPPSAGDLKRFLSIIKDYVPTARLRGTD